LSAIKSVSNDNDLMIITETGLTIRLAVNSISVLGRATQGVRVINLKEDDRIASVARVSIDETETEVEEDIDNEDNNIEQE
jgi:DNA gyrase subunit A